MTFRKIETKRIPEPPVGVLAKTQNIARSLIRELNISRGVALSPGGKQGNGLSFTTLLVDDSAWPMDDETKAALMPSLDHTCGYVLRISRT